MPTEVAPTGLALQLGDVEDADRRIDGLVHRTPMLRCNLLDAAVGAEVHCKAEHMQRSGSFKIRGALNRLLQLSDDERSRGVVAFSSGNHAQGVALAARIVGIDATIVMPADAPTVKKDATRAYGATIVEYDRYTEDRQAVAARIAEQRGCVIVPPYDDLRVVAGQGTCGLEVFRDLDDIDVLVVPVGGGGLIAGMSVVARAKSPSVRIVGVEPVVADDARRSLEAGHIVRIEQPVTIADGVATASLGVHTFPIISALVDEIVTVTEDEILDATLFVMTRMKQVVEPTGALTTAALLNRRMDVKGARVVSVFCGGNLDLDVLSRRAS